MQLTFPQHYGQEGFENYTQTVDLLQKAYVQAEDDLDMIGQSDNSKLLEATARRYYEAAKAEAPRLAPV